MTQDNVRHNNYMNCITELFSLFQAPSEELKTFVATVLLIRDSTTLLNGIYGTGKTQLVHLVRKLFFNHSDGSGSDFGYITCTQDLAPLDTLFYMDLARLMQGYEEVSPREVVTARFKFINEAQRANTLVYNALLPLLSEKQVVYRDKVFKSPDYLCLLDANPHDTGSSEMPQAFRDRIDYSFCLPKTTTMGLLNLQGCLISETGIHMGLLSELTDFGLTSEEMTGIWDDVSQVLFSDEVKQLCVLISSHLQRCTRVDRSVTDEDHVLNCDHCEFRGEICSKLNEIPGTRFMLSLMKLAQARAWLRKSDQVGIEDVYYGLPYSLAHRLNVKSDSRRTFVNSHQWIIENLYQNGLRPKAVRWQKLIHYLKHTEIRDASVLSEFSSRDLAAADLINTMTQQEFRKVY